MTSLDEFGLIARLFAPLAAGYPGALGLKDDAALVECPSGRQLVVTMDAIVAGVHYLPDDPPELVARKLVRVNLSDLAAKGAQPEALFLAAAFPKGATAAWLEAFAAGLAADCAEFNVPLAGGDTVATPGPPTFALTAIGSVERGRAMLRSGAAEGDEIWVSGTLGDGALGLRVLQGGLATLAPEHRVFLAGRYHLPQPRLELGRLLCLRGVARACMDVSDGLVGDLGHLCAASGVGAVVEAALLPLSSAAQACDDSRLASAMAGGDDYELLFAVPLANAAALRDIAKATGVAVTRIGRVVAGQGVRVIDGAGGEITPSAVGYRHF